MPRKYHGARALLNLPGFHTTGSIVAEIEDSSAWPEGKGRNGEAANRYVISPDIVCDISDCDRAIHLIFDISSAEEMENSMYKIDTLIDTLHKFRRGLILEHNRYVDRAEKLPANKTHGAPIPTRLETDVA